MQGLGLNAGGYRGARIDIQRVLRDLEAQIHDRKDWVCERMATGLPTDSLNRELLAFQRSPSGARKRVYISTGIHGDEPAGPLTALRLLREDCWPEGVAVWLCPCLNPAGFAANRRENGDGIDLNRDYRHRASPEVRAHVAWLERQPDFDLALCLHEDWESKGFYLYELNPDNRPSFARAIAGASSQHCPVDESPVIDHWPADCGVIHPPPVPAVRPLWAESIYLLNGKTRLTYTLEAPSDFPLEARVNALVAGVRAVLETL